MVKIPAEKEIKKNRADLHLGKGQIVEVVVGNKKLSAVVLGPAKKRNYIIVRIKESHHQKKLKEKFMYFPVIKRTPFWDYVVMEKKMGIDEFSRVLKLTRTFSVHINNIIVRDPSRPKYQRVPNSQKGKQRKKTLIEQARMSILGGKNPKRVYKELKRKGVRVPLYKLR